MGAGNQSVRMLAQPLRSLAFGSISGTYAAIGTPLGQMVRIIHVSNLTDQTMTFSFTGNTDHFVLPSGSFILLDLTANEIGDGGWFVSEGTQLYVKQTSTPPTSGAVYVSAFYAAQVARN